MSAAQLLAMANGTAVPLQALPQLGLEAFRAAIIGAPARKRRVSALFGGSARLEADQGRGTSIILDWPARIADGPASA